jgi:3-dehydroquinate dehydratase-2
MAAILVLHGPNLNLLGQRQPEIYGKLDLSTIDANLTAAADGLGHTLTSYQSNSEAQLIDTIQAAQKTTAFIIFNPAAYAHTSIALRDALLAVNIPFIEVHLSNIYQREPFRRTSYFSDIAIGVISGFKEQSYHFALLAAHQHLTTEE